MTDKPLRCLFSPFWNLNPGPLFSFINDEPLSYSVRLYLRTSITQNPSQFRYRYKNQVVFDPQTQNNTVPIPQTETSQVWSPAQNYSKCRPPRQNQGQLRCTHINQAICGPYPKTESISATTTHNQVNRYWYSKKLRPHMSNTIPRTKNTPTSISILKPSQIRFLTQKSSSFRRHYWNQVISIPTPKSSQFWCLHTKTKLTFIHALNSSILRPRPPRKNQVNSDPYAGFKSI